MKVTQWFPSSANPTRKGVYEFEHLPYPFHYWTGKHWAYAAGETPAAVMKQMARVAGRKLELFYASGIRWRGIAK